MGTLHEVYQLKPIVLTAGAILKVRKNKRIAFIEKYIKANDNTATIQGLFGNVFAVESINNRVERIAIYAIERQIYVPENTWYICIQDGSKYGFGSDFDSFLEEISPYLEDALFYVIWDSLIDSYTIKAGKLFMTKAKNFSNWDYDFWTYISDKYKEDMGILANYCKEEIIEMQLRHEEMIAYGEVPKELYYDIEDYEDLGQKFNAYKAYIDNAIFEDLNYWIQSQIDNY